jgi:cbb3-type cytochrome oxidase maturation protein
MRSGQFDDLEGACWRAIADDDLPEKADVDPKPLV